MKQTKIFIFLFHNDFISKILFSKFWNVNRTLCHRWGFFYLGKTLDEICLTHKKSKWTLFFRKVLIPTWELSRIQLFRIAYWKMKAKRKLPNFWFNLSDAPDFLQIDVQHACGRRKVPYALYLDFFPCRRIIIW